MNFTHKKSLGQHFLTSDMVPRWLCDAAEVNDTDTVLEIGPGTGILTKELLARGAKVITLEADQRAITVLEETFAEPIATGQLVVHHLDVRDLDLAKIEGLNDQQFKIVANIPYYLSGHLFRTCLQTSCQPSDLVFLVQKEVAKRASANETRGEKHSLLSLSIQAYGEVSYVKTVSRGHFNPSPKVDSGIVAVHHISRHNFSNVSETDFFRVLKLGFAQKRKQLLGNLTSTYGRESLQRIFVKLQLPETIRAEDVRLDKWLSLATELAASGK